VNKPGRRWKVRAAFYGFLAGLNLSFVGMSLAIGRTPSTFEVLFGALFLWWTATSMIEGPRIPLRTGLSSDMIHVEYAGRTDTHAIQSIESVRIRFSWGSALKMEMKMTDGSTATVPGIAGYRIRKIQWFVEKQKADPPAQEAATAAVVAGGGPKARVVGPDDVAAPRPISAAAAPDPDAAAPDPDAGASDWNTSQLADGTVRPDVILTSRNVTIDKIPRGEWISTGRKFAKRQQAYVVLLLLVAIPLMVVAVGQISGVPNEVLLPMAVVTAVILAAGAGLVTQRDVQGHVGRSIMRMPAAVTAEEDARALVGSAVGQAGLALSEPREARNRIEWTLGTATTISLSATAGGSEAFLAIISKDRVDLDLHRRIKGEVLRGLVLQANSPAASAPTTPSESDG
jgi:hypothetical protein